MSRSLFARVICLLTLISVAFGAVVLPARDSTEVDSAEVDSADSASVDLSSSDPNSYHVPGQKLCKNPLRRKEWRDMNVLEKASYITAVKCLQRLPAVTKLPGVKTQFDDFQALHVSLTYQIHWVGQFLHWHRLMLHLYETKLRDKCGYNGAQPYWDWTRDADHGDITHSPIFHPVTGFGGNGEYIPGYAGPFGNMSVVGTGGGCLIDGPFKGFNLSVGPGTINTNHCLTRAINNNSLAIMTTAQVQNTTKQPTFELFRQEAGGAFRPPPRKLHDGGHGAINGEMSNVFSSPGDPLFYLHHGGLDRVWWMWQEKDRSKRLTDVSGNTVYNTTTPTLTLDFLLKADKISPSVPVRDVMDTRGEYLCYIYV